MISLNLPAEASDDDAVLREICASTLFAPHHGTWQTAYNKYRRRRGNPFGVAKTAFAPDIQQEQEKLYHSRRTSAPFTHIRRTVLPCCPMCGSPGTGALDHHLPEGTFGEFAMLRANLIPSCGHCNSSKSNKTKGESWPERFLHPYYDRFGYKPIWRIRVLNPDAPEFVPEPMPELRQRLKKLMTYHLTHMLGWQFQMHSTNFWASLPLTVSKGLRSGTKPGSGKIQSILKDRMQMFVDTEGLNGWKAAMLRGICDDGCVHAHITAAALNLPAPVKLVV